MVRFCGLVLVALTCGLGIDRAYYPTWAEVALNNLDCKLSYSEPRWQLRRIGFETGFSDIFCDGQLVDRVQLSRIEQDHYALSVHYNNHQPRLIEDWQRELDAIALINGSFFSLDRTPETPIKSAGSYFGPEEYDSTHGAVVAGRHTEILDLKGKDVLDELIGRQEAMVSYPLLLDSQQRTRAAGKHSWIANRSFVALDAQSRIILATTENGFFSLRRLGEFLELQPFAIQSALNLDGGPVASQIVRTGNFERIVRGRWYTNDSTNRWDLIFQGFKSSGESRKLPIVLAVLPRNDLSDVASTRAVQ